MQRSSESIAALASALAKAQAQLVNPEKTLTAVVRPSRAGERERTFRYAPLASGLDIVRKTLGEHEIAILQTTAIDQSSGIVNLTTTLAHASGEWVASVWPICPVAEMAMPQRMGAALTYARRYALFTLVGIAGEDDLDSPDLDRKSEAAGQAELPAREHNNGLPGSSRGPGNGRLERGGKNRAAALREELSASLREMLLAQIANLTSRDRAAGWARNALAAKNSLTAGDAKLVEEAFEQQLRGFPQDDGEQSVVPEATNVSAEPAPVEEDEGNKPGRAQPHRINSGLVPVSPAKRHRNKAHLHHVAQQPCLICARQPADAHHLRFMQPRGLGLKVSDEFAVPLCRMHHRQVHHAGNERAWWQMIAIDPTKIARRLWEETRASKKGAPPGGPAAEANGSSKPAETAITAAPAP
jgi:ERF superfamily protein